MMDLHGWIFGEDLDRERLLDMDRRLAPVRRNALIVVGGGLLAAGPWTGWWTIVPLVLAAVLFTVANRRGVQAQRPEYPILGAWIASEAILAGAIVLAGGPKLVPLGLFVIPIVTLPARFSARVVKLGAVIALIFLNAVAFGTDAGAVIHNPTLVLGPSVTVIAVAMLLVALMRSDIEHRGECVIDQLTGLLNRKALATRSDELEQQSAITGEPVGVIVCDLDHFKTVNDRHGHATGDAVLSQVAYRLRKRLRAFDLVYRLGGEEFLVLVPGADLVEATELAEALRETVNGEPSTEGCAVTISFGVSASQRGQIFDYEAVFHAADDALYRAKQGGRDRVCVAGPAVEDGDRLIATTAPAVGSR
jgi:diguanylate cyclase (GGDEF)-like protein